MADQPVDVEVSSREWDEAGKTARCEFTSDEEIVTEAQAMAKGQIDTSVWYVKRMRIGAHTVAMKLRQERGRDRNGKPLYVHIPIKKSCWKISLDLERIQGDVQRQAMDAVYARLKDVAANGPPRVKSQPKSASGRHLVELGIYDHHFGALVWAPEAYSDYDLKIAEEMYQNAVVDLMDRVRGYKVSRWVFPFGNDLMHFDNLTQTTTGGTFQDADSRYAKVLVAAEMAVVRAIHEMRRVAPVDVIPILGNHDTQSMHALARIINAHFRNTPGVRVDTQPRPRKYYRYGCNVIGYTHGNEEKIQDLTRLMPLELPADVWAETTTREFHVGHWHKSKGIQTVDTDNHSGIEVIVNPSLKATDAWHYRRGFVGARRAARAFLYDYHEGAVGRFEITARLGAGRTRRVAVDVFDGGS